MAASKTPARRAQAAPETLAACKRAMRANEAEFRAYMAARRVKNAAVEAGDEAGAVEAQVTMEAVRRGYTVYWRAYTRALALRKEAS